MRKSGDKRETKGKFNENGYGPIDDIMTALGIVDGIDRVMEPG